MTDAGSSTSASPPIPPAEWTAQQLRDAFPWDTAPRYLLRDRDRIFGDAFSKQVQDMAIQEVLSAPRSPWQRAYVERVIGTIRRECLDHVIVFSEASLYRHVKSFVKYYHESRTHLSLGKDSPESRAVHFQQQTAIDTSAVKTARQRRQEALSWRSQMGKHGRAASR